MKLMKWYSQNRLQIKRFANFTKCICSSLDFLLWRKNCIRLKDVFSTRKRNGYASQKLSCTIQNFWSVRRDGNCNCSENIFLGWKLFLCLLNISIVKKVWFSCRPIQCVKREWKSISTAKKVPARQQSPKDFKQSPD